jgi:hypothetical protein
VQSEFKMIILGLVFTLIPSGCISFNRSSFLLLFTVNRDASLLNFIPLRLPLTFVQDLY